MEKSLLKNKEILMLEEKIKQGNNEALNEFWNEIEKNGTPLIESLENDLENYLVTFVYKMEEEVENIVFIPPVGMEKFTENKMERLLGTNLWYISYKIRNNVRVKYAFSINDSLDINCNERWDKLEYDKFNKKRLFFKGIYGDKDEIASYVVMPKADKQYWVQERSNISKGNIHEHEFSSKNLEKRRRVRVYTPHDYNEDVKPYGFLVLTDGDEYINVLSAKVVLDNLIYEKKIPPIVTVFIDSTETRMEELRCNDTFESILIEELIPWVRDNYNISEKAEDAVIGGLSLGGLTAGYIGLKHSEVFGNVLSESGSFWYKPESYEGYEPDCWISTEFKKVDKLPLKFYLNVGVLEHPQGMIGTNIILRDVLREKGYTVDFEYFNSGHDYLSWGETLAHGLISLIGTK